MKWHPPCDASDERENVSKNGTRPRGGGIYIHGVQMIVGKCPNPAPSHGAAERRGRAAAPKSTVTDNNTVSANALVSQEKFRLKAVPRLNRPDASFVTHLIATAEQVPQTRTLRRASVADAMSYYDAATEVASSGSRAKAVGLSRMV